MATLVNFRNPRDTHGTKRKAKADLYKPMNRHPNQPSFKLQQSDSPDTAATSNTDVESSLAHVKAPDVAYIQSGPLMPEAPMGGLDLLSNDVTGATAALAPKQAQAKPAEEPAPARGKVNRIVTRSTRQVRGKDGEKEKQKENGEREQQQEEDTREEREITKLLRHRMTNNRSGAIELLVQWVDESEQDATWEAEEEIQQDAEEVLYEYWNTHGGRTSTLFYKPKDAPLETYYVFKVLRHEKQSRGGFQFEVQWVGHSAASADTTMEPEPKLKNIAPKLLHEYWESVGGRASHLTPRGRAKKPRNE
ncbi:hypothetical protein F5Y08DRAFT_349641 [Xylaria arbuscula]|nr:hypothetical protein F5Y08DRAFT_349641 [Xylaria arbuscula]